MWARSRTCHASHRLLVVGYLEVTFAAMMPGATMPRASAWSPPIATKRKRRVAHASIDAPAKPPRPCTERGRQCRLDSTQIVGRRLSGPSIRNDIVRYLLTFIETVHSGALNCAHVHKNVLAAVVGLNEAESLLAIEPFYGSLRHD